MNLLGCNDHTVVEFAVLREIGEEKGKVKPLNFREVNFQHFKEVVNRTSWETALRDKGAEQRWQVFRDSIHKSARALDASVKNQEIKPRDLHGWVGTKGQEGNAQAVDSGYQYQLGYEHTESSLPRKTWGYCWMRGWTRASSACLQPRETNASLAAPKAASKAAGQGRRFSLSALFCCDPT